MARAPIYNDHDERSKDLGNQDWYDSTLKDIQNLPESDDLENSWNADNSDYDESNPASKSKKDLSSDELADQEAGVDESSGQDTATSAREQEATGANDDSDDFGYSQSNEPKSRWQKLRGKITRRRAAVGGGIGLLVGSGIGISIFFSGPLKILHVAEFLKQEHLASNEDFGNDRTSRLIRYVRSGGDARNLRLGRIGSKFATRWESRILSKSGLRALYTPGTTRFVGYEVVDENKARSTLDDLDRSDNIRPTTSTRSFVDGDGNVIESGRRVINLDGTSYSNRRSVIRTVVAGTDVNDVGASVMARLLQKWGGVDFHPLKNIRRRATDTGVDYINRVREGRAERNAQGVRDADVNAPNADVDDPDNPTPDENLAREASDQASDVLDDIDGVTGDADVPRTSPEFKSRLARIKGSFGLKIAGGAAAVVGIICAVDGLGDGAELVQYANTILPMMRMGMMMVAAGDQIKAGQDVNVDELGTLASSYYDEETKTGLDAAASWQYEAGQTPAGPDISPDARPSKVGDKPWLFEQIDKIPFLGQACDLNGWFGSLPGVKQISDATSFGIDQILGIFNTSQDELVGALVNFLAGSGVDLYASGAALGNIANYGVRLAANTTALAMGGVELLGFESSQLDAHSELVRKEELSQKSLAARLFDTSTNQSLISQIASRIPTSANEAVAGVMSAPSELAGLVTGSAQAQGTYSYGFPEIGFSLSEQESQVIEDPYANAEVVEANIASLDETYGKCFPKRINPNTLDIVDTENYNGGRYDSLNNHEDCQSKSDDFLQYRAYIADRGFEASLGCYEGDSEACEIVGFTGTVASGTPTAPSNGITDPSGYIPNCGVNDGNAAIACTAISQLSGIPYENSTQLSPTTPDPVEFLDCSALVAMAIYRTFGLNRLQCSVQFNNDPEYFQRIDIHDIQPGDLLGRGTVCNGAGGTGHIGIVVSYDPATRALVTVESYTRRLPSGIRTDAGLAVDGTGSYEWAVRYIGPKNPPAPPSGGPQ